MIVEANTSQSCIPASADLAASPRFSISAVPGIRSCDARLRRLASHRRLHFDRIPRVQLCYLCYQQRDFFRQYIKVWLRMDALTHNMVRVFCRRIVLGVSDLQQRNQGAYDMPDQWNVHGNVTILNVQQRPQATQTGNIPWTSFAMERGMRAESFCPDWRPIGLVAAASVSMSLKTAYSQYLSARSECGPQSNREI